MANDFSNKIKEVKKKLKNFQKISSKDKEKSVQIAKELIEDCDLILSRSDLKLNDKGKADIEKTKDALNLYIKQVKEMEEFSKKWE